MKKLRDRDREVEFLENFRELKNYSWRTLFWVLHPPQMVIFLWNFVSTFTFFILEKKGEIFPFHSFREVQVKEKWLEIEIEKWKWNEKASRSRSKSEISQEFSRILGFYSWHTLFLVLHPPRMLNFFYASWCQISLIFLKKKSENFSPSLSRNESEIEMTGNRDREVKAKWKSFEIETEK